MDLPVCRVCLVSDISRSVRDTQLRETYERLAGAKFYSVDPTPVPVTLCYYCYWQLRKFCSFAAQVRSSHEILKEAIKCGAKIGLKYIQNLPKKCHLTISTTKTQSLEGSIKRKVSTNPLKAKKVKGENLNVSLKPLPDNTQNLNSIMKKSSLSSLELHLTGNTELIIKKQKKPEKLEGELVQINTEIEIEQNKNEKLIPNKKQSTENKAQSVSSLELHLAGNPELIIKKQKKPEKIVAEIVKISTEIEIEPIENEKLIPNKKQSTENEAQSVSSLELHLAGNPELIIKRPKKTEKCDREIVQINTEIEMKQNKNEKLIPNKKQSTENKAQSVSSLELHLAGNPELIIKKQKKPKKFEAEIVQINTEIEIEPNENEKLIPNKNQSTEKKAQSVSSLKLNLAGNPELIIKKQKKPEKIEGKIVKLNAEIEIDHNENEKQIPNKKQSTENKAQSDLQMKEYLDFDYDKYYDKIFDPSHKSKKIVSTEKYPNEHKKTKSKIGSNLKETQFVTQTCEIIQIKKKDMNGFNQSGQVFRLVADTSVDIQNLNMVAEYLEIESDSDLRTNLLVNDQDNQDTVYQIEENVHHQDRHNNNTESETLSIENDLEDCDIEIKKASQSKNIDGTINSASNHLSTAIEDDMNKLIYKCNFCNKILQTKENLDEHKLAHTMSVINTQIKKFTCKECGQKFSSQILLDGHIRKHTKERPFMCEICGKSFRIRSNLESHLFQVHSKSKHVCKLCNKSFKSKNYLYNYHLNTHFNVRPFVCPVCKRAFHQSCTVWEHIRNVHQGRRRYACHICDAKSDTKSHFDRHMITHSGTKAFSCDYCNMDFTTKGTMRRHVVNYCKMK